MWLCVITSSDYLLSLIARGQFETFQLRNIPPQKSALCRLRHTLSFSWNSANFKDPQMLSSAGRVTKVQLTQVSLSYLHLLWMFVCVTVQINQVFLPEQVRERHKKRANMEEKRQKKTS